MKKIKKNEYTINANRNSELQRNFEKLTPEEKFRSEVENVKGFDFTYSCRKLIKITVPAERMVTVLFPRNNRSLFLFIFQFNDIMDDRGDRGSADYTNRVMKTASDCLSKLTSKNTFKPKVITRVSHTGRSFIGASIAVSHFLRPICLFHRIINLKQSLGKAIVHFQPLNIPDRQNWLFEALYKPKYDLIRSPCQNCNMMFCNDRSGNGWSTFLAACAEYCPVNQLLPDEPNLRQSASHDPLVMNLLRRNHARCSDLFENFLEISNKCIAAARSNDENIMEAVYWEVIYKLHIFGLRPECNPYF